MAFDIELEPDEKLILCNEFQADRHTEPFAFAVSDRAIFITRIKHFVRDPYYFERVPLASVKQVSLKRGRPLFMWVLAFLFFGFGLTLTFLMMMPVLRGEEGYVSGVPIAMTVCGLILPFIAKGRKVLTVELKNETYKWKPRLVVDKKSREQIQKLQEGILNACEQVGIKILKENGSTLS